MYTNQRNISRVLAAAVASTGFAIAPMPGFAAGVTCTSATFSATPDGAGNIVVSCTSPGSTAACSLTASPTSLPAAGGTVTLTASNCGTISSWTKAGTLLSQSSSSWKDSIPPNTNTQPTSFIYTVNGANGASVTVSQNGAGTVNPPPTGGAISCSGYTTTLVYDLAWTAQSVIDTKGFNNNAIIVARFTTPAAISTGTGNIASAEIQQPAVFRTASISTNPCDLAGTGVGKSAVWSGLTSTKGPGGTFQVGGTAQTFLLSASRIVLQPSTTYYFNIVNRDSGGSGSCTASNCEMRLQLTKAPGT